MKRRAVKNTKANRDILIMLKVPFTVDEAKNRIYIKVSNSDIVVITTLLPDS